MDVVCFLQLHSTHYCQLQNIKGRALQTHLLKHLLSTTLWFTALVGITFTGTPAQGNVRYGLPGRRFAGSMRCFHECIADEQNTQVLLIPPEILQATEEALPTFFFYLPTTIGNPAIEFVLLGDDEETLYATTLTGNATEGIAQLDLSTVDNPPNLEGNQIYRWYVNIVCNEHDRTLDLAASGWVMRLNTSEISSEQNSVELRIGTNVQEMQVDSLHDSVRWTQNLSALDAIRRSEPNNQDAELQWQALLAEQNLESIGHAVPIDVVFNEN